MTLDRINDQYSRTLAHIGDLRDMLDTMHRSDSMAIVVAEELEAAQSRATVLARMLGLEYDEEYDC